MDAWATCHGVGIAPSPTAVLDGSYGLTVTQADVVSSGDCTDCGNAGTYRLVIGNGRYALYRPVSINSNPTQPSVAFYAGWQPDDTAETGTVSITGDLVTLVPETNQQFGSVPLTYTFELFHGLLTLHPLSQDAWDTTRPWRKLS
jgi:hypothetical protein